MATIELVVTQSTTLTEGANLAADSIVNGNLAQILTLNYTDCEPATGSDGVQYYQGLWEQAAAQGITVVAPAGDTGAAGCDNHFTEIAATGGLNAATGNRAAPTGLAVNAVASTPYNVAVGTPPPTGVQPTTPPLPPRCFSPPQCPIFPKPLGMILARRMVPMVALIQISPAATLSQVAADAAIT
jgi:subtilase family serine protease